MNFLRHLNAQQFYRCDKNIEHCQFLPIMETEEDGDNDDYNDDYMNYETFKMELQYSEEKRIVQQIQAFRKIILDFLPHPVKTEKEEIRRELRKDIKQFQEEFPEQQVTFAN